MPTQVIVSIIGVIISLVTGGLAGALVNSYLTRKRQKLEITLKLVDYFLSIYSEVADVYAFFLNNNTLTDKNERNKVKKVGDWFEWVLILVQSDSVDVDLLKQAGILNQIEIFLNYVKGFRAKFEELNVAWASWTNLQQFKP